MKKILIQHSQSALFTVALEILEGQYDLIIASDDTLGEALSKNKKEITAIIFFELSDQALKLSKLARNERFCDPTIPIAYVGNESSSHAMPFGSTRFDDDNIGMLFDFLQLQLEIRTLIVEDDDGLRDITALTLSKNMVVESASNGDDAYRMIQNNVYHLVVLDVMLPGKSGDELFAHLREKAPDTAIVIITAFDTDEREFQFTFGGAAGYIKKPFESNKVFRQQVMDAVLSHYDKTEAARLVVVQSKRNIALENRRIHMNKYV